ncbi:uncharacterized protein [Watersipora subatra]|uniref:uncharacterized protein n=1 Tax=Watersipora subatra TaxID=2589382 RepID=UPI00355BF404
MYKAIIFAVLCSVIGLSVDATDYLRCYECSAYQDDQDDVANCPYQDFNPQANITTKECDEAACVKTAEDTDKGLYVKRRCIQKTDADDLKSFHGCRNETDNVVGRTVNVQVCVCHNDYCNTAASLATPFYLVILAVVAKLLA